MAIPPHHTAFCVLILLAAIGVTKGAQDLKECANELDCKDLECIIYYNHDDREFILCYNETCRNSSYEAEDISTFWNRLMDKQDAKAHVQNGFVYLDTHKGTEWFVFNDFERDTLDANLEAIRKRLDERTNIALCKDGDSGKGTTQPATDGGSGDWFPGLGVPIHWLVVIGAVAFLVVVGVCYYFCKSGEATPVPDVERGSRRRSRRSSARHSIDSRPSMASRHSMTSRQSRGRSMSSRHAMSAPSSAHHSHGTPSTRQSASRASSASRRKSSTSRFSYRYRS